MNALAIIHQGREIDCFALDSKTFRIRISTARDDFKSVELCYALNKYMWDTERETAPMRRWASDGQRDYYQFDLSGQDTRLAYIFILRNGKRHWYFSEEGLSQTFDFSRAHYSYFQNPFIHACDVHQVVSWADTAVMYQIFPERFANGLGRKEYVNTPWDGEPTPDSFFGGDLPGIEQHLDYLGDLGVNCVYLTPVQPAPSNHKYNIVDYETVDEAFGGEAAFRSLVQAAHGRGMRVVLDGVFNHCSALFAPFQDVLEKGKGSAYWHWFLIDGDKVDRTRVNYRTFGFVPDMPKLNTGHQDVIRYFCSIGAKWVRDFGIDGWRVDVMDEISTDFLRAFRKAVKRENPDALILGETWHDPRSWLMGDRMDGVMNYAVTKALMDYLVTRTLDARGLAAQLIRLQARTSSQAARMMMNLIGSHDTHRFLTLLGGDTRRLKLAFCILFFYVGIPCVYYGDEIGMEGGYDPGCRRAFPWDEAKWNHELQALVRQLSGLRAAGKLAGDEITVAAYGNALSIVRPGARLLLNATEQPVTITIGGSTHALDAWGYSIDTL